MRKISFLMMFLIASMSLCMTSCLGDDDNENNITEEQIIAARKAVSGSYTGYLKYLVSSSTAKDSIGNVEWAVNDSLITIYDFPVSMLAAGLDSTNIKLKTALEQAPNQIVKCYYGFYNTQNFGNPYYQMAVAPKEITTTVTVDGKPRTLTFSFVQGNSYYASIYSTTQRAIGLYLLTNGMKQDGSVVYAYKQMMFILESKTKY